MYTECVGALSYYSAGPTGPYPLHGYLYGGTYRCWPEDEWRAKVQNLQLNLDSINVIGNFMARINSPDELLV